MDKPSITHLAGECLLYENLSQEHHQQALEKFAHKIACSCAEICERRSEEYRSAASGLSDGLSKDIAVLMSEELSMLARVMRSDVA